MSLLKQSTARDKMVLMVDDTDHVTGKTGLTLTITASKNGGAFASISPTVTERSDGWYSLALTTSHTDTLGDLVLHVTGTDADPSDPSWQVVVDLPGASIASLGTQAKADVNAEVLDVLNVDTFAEIGQETPAATQTIRKMLGYLYKFARNRMTSTATQISVYNDDATTVGQKFPHSNVSGTYDRSEGTTGP